MSEIPQAARDAARDAGQPYAAATAEAVGIAAAMQAMLQAAAPYVEAAVRERIATQVEACAANYPQDVFPPASDSREAISAVAMRHAYRNAAHLIRERGCDDV